MIMDINQKHLEEAISELEKGYVTSMIELIKVPVFKKRIVEELKTEKDSDKINQLEGMLKNNDMQVKGHSESIENVTEILKEVYKLRK